MIIYIVVRKREFISKRWQIISIHKVFKSQGKKWFKSMSTNWSKYSSAENTKSDPSDKIIVLNVGDVRRIRRGKDSNDFMTVIHHPLKDDLVDNQAHTDVMGLETKSELNKVYMRNELKKISQVI